MGIYRPGRSGSSTVVCFMAGTEEKIETGTGLAFCLFPCILRLFQGKDASVRSDQYRMFALALFNDGYAIPLTALLFFLLPLIFALAFGRVFCAGVCPLGAIQELTGIRPVKLPKAVESVMISIPFIYLGISLLAAATESQFLICRYDPFVGIFRLDAPYTMIIFGGAAACRRNIYQPAPIAGICAPTGSC